MISNKDIRAIYEAQYEEYGQLCDTGDIEIFAASIYKRAIEDAAELCDIKWNGDSDTYTEAEVSNNCAAAIRELLL